MASCVVNVKSTDGINTTTKNKTPYYIKGNTIFVNNPNKTTYTISSLDGKLIYKGFAQETTLKHGIYILHLNGAIYRIFI